MILEAISTSLKDLQELVKLLLAIPTFLAGTVAIYQLLLIRRRNKLRFDLEMLKLYKEVDGISSRYQDMKLRIDEKVQMLYPAPDKMRTDLDRSDVLWSCLLLIIAGIAWTLAAEESGKWQFSLYGIALGCLLAGIFGFYLNFKRKARYRRKRKKS